MDGQKESEALRRLQAQVEDALARIERQQVQLEAQESSIRRLERTQTEMLGGRAWRTLQFAANAVRRVSPARKGSRSQAEALADYQRWILEFEQPDFASMDAKVQGLPQRPLISVVVPVYNTEPAELEAAIESVLQQSYSNWQLSISDDASSRGETKQVLQRWADADPRIQIVHREQRGGISANANTALEHANGDYVCFLDHDDVLARHALAFLCEAVERHPDADFLYSDEDKLDRAGSRFDPFMKPDWSPDLLLSENYLCHLLTLRRDLLDKVGRFNSAFDGSQDYDLILRASEQAGRIHHIPKVLYHWRAGAISTAANPRNKEYAVEAARKALQSACGRVTNGATVVPGRVSGRWRIRYPIPKDLRVSIIIASGGNRGVLRKNLQSLLGKTSYSPYEIVIADNSRAEAIHALTASFQRRANHIRYFDWRERPFNYSAINNAAAQTCDSPFLLFLNDDTAVIESGWLEAMVELAVRAEVGAVGAKLLYPNGHIQHAGVVMGLHGNCGHAFAGLDGRTQHYFDFPDVIRNVSAVTGACLLTKSDVFRNTGGFDETQFPIAFNDIDYCLKVGELGYRVLYTPHALLYHREAYSKGSEDLVPRPAEVDSLRERWGSAIAADPFYSPNLTRDATNYSLRR